MHESNSSSGDRAVRAEARRACSFCLWLDQWVRWGWDPPKDTLQGCLPWVQRRHWFSKKAISMLPWNKLLVSILPSPKLKFLVLASFLSVSPDPIVTGCSWWHHCDYYFSLVRKKLSSSAYSGTSVQTWEQKPIRPMLSFSVKTLLWTIIWCTYNNLHKIALRSRRPGNDCILFI